MLKFVNHEWESIQSDVKYRTIYIECPIFYYYYCILSFWTVLTFSLFWYLVILEFLRSRLFNFLGRLTFFDIFRTLSDSLGFLYFYWRLLTFVDFLIFLLSFTDFYYLLLTFINCYWLLLTFINFYWFLLTFIDYY